MFLPIFLILVLNIEMIMLLELIYQSGLQMELDVYIPSLNLAFEYQGIQHYLTSKYFADSSSHINTVCNDCQ